MMLHVTKNDLLTDVINYSQNPLILHEDNLKSKDITLWVAVNKNGFYGMTYPIRQSDNDWSQIRISIN